MPAMVLARLVMTAVSVAICCANLAFDGALPAMFGFGMCDCLVLGEMVGSCVDLYVHRLDWLTCLFLKVPLIELTLLTDVTLTQVSATISLVRDD